jgi:uncharacterized protein
MKFHLTQAAGQNMITGYGDGYIAVNTQRYTRPVIVTPNREISDWDVENFATLTRAHFEALLELKPEIVLLGTGERQQFPRPELARVLTEAGVGVEAMDTKAACRTYNILMSEGREVLAAIIV